MGKKKQRLQTTTTNTLTRNNFYGFNDMVWMSVKADNELEAEKIIRAACKLNNKVPLTIKPLI